MLVALKHSTENIGDDIQRIGLASILPEDTVWIDREDRNALLALQPDDKLIVSGWFNKGRHHWYSDIKAQCLFVGFYIDSPIEMNATIGCRDTHTLGFYANSWLSYCTSMLLPPNGEARNGVVLCDLTEAHKARIPDDFVQHATIVSHNNFTGDRDVAAKRLLDIYANAELVITGRLHVLLPCLATVHL